MIALTPATMSTEDAEARQGKITGTLIAQIAGMSKYGGPHRAWQKLVGQLDDTAPSNPMRWGNRLQPAIALARLDDLNEEGPVYDLDAPGYLQHPTLPWAGASLDYVVMTAEDRVRRWILEIKNVGLWNLHEWGEEGTDFVPADVLCQVHWQMGVANAVYGDGALPFAEVCPLFGGSDARVYRVERDPEFEALLLETAEKFFERFVKVGVAPEPDDSDECRRYLAGRYPVLFNEEMVANDAAEEWALRYRKASVVERVARAEKDLAVNNLIDIKGAHRKIVGVGWSFSTFPVAETEVAFTRAAYVGTNFSVSKKGS